jgi:hypothetical protein
VIWDDSSQRRSIFQCRRACVIRFAAFAFGLILGASSVCAGQLTVKNPDHLFFPENRARVIFSTACKVVASEFHVRHGSKVEFPLIVVLGDAQERYTADLTTQTYTIYLRHWDDVQFAAYSMGLAMQLLVPQEQRTKLVAEILRRSDELLPVPVEALRDKNNAAHSKEKDQSSLPTNAAVSPQR